MHARAMAHGAIDPVAAKCVCPEWLASVDVSACREPLKEP
jgi:hypothetical protein